MIRLDEVQLGQFRTAVNDAANRDDVRNAIANVYRALQDRIELRRPICTASGRCCRFDEFGHRLFVTTMELATFLGALSPSLHCREEDRDDGSSNALKTCPFQVANLCSVHAIRPFGCRVFFCDQTSTDWQHEQYRCFHTELKRLHECLKIPYFYVEWRQALAAMNLVDGSLWTARDSL